MNDILLILVILSFTFIVYRYIEYLRATRGTEGFFKKKAVQYLFLGFIALIGITTVFAEALFEWLGLKKPVHFEWLSLIAYAVFAIAAVFVTRDKGKLEGKIQASEEEKPTTAVNQTHHGTGDNVGGDKKVYNINNTGAMIKEQYIGGTVQNKEGQTSDSSGSAEQILLDKLAYLREQAAIRTGGSGKFQIKKEIEETERELRNLRGKL